MEAGLIANFRRRRLDALGLLFLAYVGFYFCRVSFFVAKGDLAKEFDLDKADTGLIVSTYLTPGNPETGELKMLPGSWQTACAPIDADHPKAPRGVSFAAQPGDVSLHYGDTMHAAPPPTRGDLDAYRISAVTSYARPDRPLKNYNSVLHGREDGQIEHLSRVAERK